MATYQTGRIYRPISLATIVVKVLDSVLNVQLEKHLILHDAQLGFRPGLSPESAIACPVRYYTDKSTPVYGAKDLTKAFFSIFFVVNV